MTHCGSSSVGRALASQAEGRGFESRFPLYFQKTRGKEQGARGKEQIVMICLLLFAPCLLLFAPCPLPFVLEAISRRKRHTSRCFTEFVFVAAKSNMLTEFVEITLIAQIKP